ncbi:MAG: hypothetical protein NVSMB64_31860 [Candidatus Velthaea sp.]
MKGCVLSLAIVAAAVLPQGVLAQTTFTAPSPVPQVKWKTTPFIKLSVFPNFASPFGAVRATTSTQPSPVAGPNAVLNGGAVDFGTVQAGVNYLYRNAAHLHILSNATNFTVYAEGSADFTGTVSGSNPPSGTNGNILPIAQTLFWLTNSAANTGYTGSTPFSATQGASAYNSPTITYTTYPSPIYHGAINQTAELYYDYQLKTTTVANLGNYYVYVVYTVLPI